MSNSARIWIGYLLIALTPLSVGGAALVGELVEPQNPPLASVAVLVIFGSWFGLMCVYQVWARCWRCGESLHRISENLYGPVVLRRHCVSCGVRHSSRPLDVRSNPLGHFGKGTRG